MNHWYIGTFVLLDLSHLSLSSGRIIELAIRNEFDVKRILFFFFNEIFILHFIYFYCIIKFSTPKRIHNAPLHPGLISKN